MARYLSQTPPLTRYINSQPSSLEGLERVSHEPPKAVSSSPAPAKGRPSVGSPRQSGSASFDKPLPPEPLPPRSTPSPRTIPATQPPAYKHTPSPPCLMPMVPPKDDVTSHSPSNTLHPGAWNLTTAGATSRPVSATPSSIIDSYANRDDDDDDDQVAIHRAGTPLIAPLAQNRHTLNMPKDRLQSFERYGTDAPSSNPDGVHSAPTEAVKVSNDEGTTQKKDILAYRFDAPTGSHPQIRFHQPVWEEESLQSAEEIAMKYRNTLLPDRFSPSDYGDDSDEAAPTPVLPPLPANGPFRTLEPEVYVENKSVRAPPARASPPRKYSATGVAATTHRNNPSSSSLPAAFTARSSQASHHGPRLAPREFGSQASWEPGDDLAQLRRPSTASRSTPALLARPTVPLSLPGSSSLSRRVGSQHRSVVPHAVSNQALRDQKNLVCDRSRSQKLRVAASTGQLLRRPSLQPSGHSRSGTASSFETDAYASPIGLQSHFSDDSEDDSKTRGFSLKLKKKRPRSKTKSADESTSGISPRTTHVFTSASEGRVSSREEQASSRATSGSLTTSWNNVDVVRDYVPNLGPIRNEPAFVGPASSMEQIQNHQSLPPAPRSVTVSSSLPSPPNTDGSRRLSFQKNSTWSMPLVLARKKDAEKSDKPLTSPRLEIGWLSKIRGKKKIDAEREKWRESLKQQIKVVPSEAGDLHALVVTDEMRARSALGGGGHGPLEHF